jgi:hypothetical protein
MLNWTVQGGEVLIDGLGVPAIAYALGRSAGYDSRPSRSAIRNRFSLVKDLGLVQQFLGDLFARGPKPGSIGARWTLNDETIEEEFGQFLFGEGSRHGGCSQR